MQISFVMPIFLLLSDQISGGEVSERERANCVRWALPCHTLWKKAGAVCYLKHNYDRSIELGRCIEMGNRNRHAVTNLKQVGRYTKC